MEQPSSPRLRYLPKRNIEVQQRHCGIRHFNDVDLKKGLQSLNVTGNLLTDFEGFDEKFCPDLQILVLDQNPILSFKGFPENVPELEWLSMEDTPVARLPNFRPLAVAVVGPKLKVLNGAPVTEKDRALALTYGVREDVFPLLVKGWLPIKPVNFSNKTLWDRLSSEIDDQEKDPFALRACRLLKQVGCSIHEMRRFIKNYYEGEVKEAKKQEEEKQEDSLEAQVEKQQELIGVLATQLQALKSGNQLFNRYKNVVRAVAGDLITNDKYLEIVNNGGVVDEQKDEGEHYEELRAAVIEFLQADQYESDNELIAKMNELMNEEEDRQEDNKSESSSKSSKKSHSTSKKGESDSGSEKVSEDKKELSETESDKGSNKALSESDGEEKSASSRSSKRSRSNSDKASVKSSKSAKEEESRKSSKSDKESAKSSRSGKEEESKKSSRSEKEEESRKSVSEKGSVKKSDDSDHESEKAADADADSPKKDGSEHESGDDSEHESRSHSSRRSRRSSKSSRHSEHGSHSSHKHHKKKRSRKSESEHESEHDSPRSSKSKHSEADQESVSGSKPESPSKDSEQKSENASNSGAKSNHNSDDE